MGNAHLFGMIDGPGSIHLKMYLEKEVHMI